MGDGPKVDYGDAVRVIGGEYRNCVAAVVGISDSTSPRTYTVEFSNGKDAELAEEFLSKVDE